MNVAASSSTKFRTNYASSSSKGNGGNKPPNRSNIFCEYCQKGGHTKDKCYKLHGFPSDLKFTKGKNSSGTSAVAHGSHDNYKGKGPEGSEGRGALDMRNTTITKQQIDQLVSILEHIQTQGGNNTGNSSREIANNIAGGAVNFAGTLTCFSSITDIGCLSCTCFKLSNNSWIIDSGASNHMTFNKNLLTNIRPLPYPFLITLPNGYRVKVTEIGNACLNSIVTLYNVLFIPTFKFNLISVHCLTSDLRSAIIFNDKSCSLQGPSLKSPLEFGRSQNGLYYLCLRCHTSNSAKALPQ